MADTGGMVLLAIKMLVAPLLVAAGSVAQRRWGPAVGGRIIGLPLTALPLLLLMAVADGAHFAAAAATADQAGGPAQAAWCLTYAVAARRWRPASALAAATAVFAGLVVAADHVALPIWPATVASVAGIALALRLWPAATGAPEPPRAWRWELPLRMVVASCFTLVLSESAGALGARSAGLLGAFPLLTVILTVAIHAGSGPVAADRFLHAVLAASWSVVASLAVLALALPHLPLALAFGLAVLAALAAQSAPSPVGPSPTTPVQAQGSAPAADSPAAAGMPSAYGAPAALRRHPPARRRLRRQRASCTTLASRRPAARRVRSTS